MKLTNEGLEVIKRALREGFYNHYYLDIRDLIDTVEFQQEEIENLKTHYEQCKCNYGICNAEKAI